MTNLALNVDGLLRERDPARASVVVSGDLDIATASTLEEISAVTAAEIVALDMSGVTFMDASAVASLIRLRCSLARNGRTLCLDSVPPGPRRLLELAGVCDLLGVAEEL
jgi:anti-anti-sigma factor